MRAFLCLAVIAIPVGCADRKEATGFAAGETAYRIPGSHVRSLTREPHQFVRIGTPERRFDIIYDSRTAGRTDAHGWPVVFSINDDAAPNIDRHSIAGLKIVCRRAVNPRGACGISIGHGGADWAVRFPNRHLDDAPEIRARALAALKGYEA